jgi:glucose/arabinose dehydrogenase
MTVVAQDEESEGYSPPVSSYEGVTVAQPGGDLGEGVEIQLVKVADGLIDPINVASANDGSGRLFIVERVGFIRILNEDGTLVDAPFLDISDAVLTAFLEQGLLGLAFHPDYENNGLFYVNYVDARTNGDLFVVEYKVSEDDPNVADPESARVLYTIDEPYRNHNGGTMHFGPDGYLYIAVGDGGLAGDPYNTAQDINDVLGSILRIDVNVEGDAPYAIPDDNPFASGAGIAVTEEYIETGVLPSIAANQQAQTGAYRPGARPEIWYYGLRNPWQFTFDSETGDMYLVDVGQVAWEEINVIPAGSRGGLNFGWEFMEGGHCYPPEESVETAREDSPAAPYGVLQGCSVVGVPPVAEYSHEVGCSITGMGVYRGEEFANLDGVYFTSDFCSGRVWGLAQDDGGVWQFEELLHTGLKATGSGTSESGDVYLTACECEFGGDYDPFENPAGTLWRVVAADQVPEGAELPPPPEDEEGEEATPVASPVASPEAA